MQDRRCGPGCRCSNCENVASVSRRLPNGDDIENEELFETSSLHKGTHPNWLRKKTMVMMLVMLMSGVVIVKVMSKIPLMIVKPNIIYNLIFTLTCS